MPEEKRTVGRPRADIEEGFTKIKPFLQLGYSMHKACLFAGYPYTTLKFYYDTEDDFRNKIDREQLIVNTQARKNWVNKIIVEKDYQSSKEWLEARERDDFAKRKELTGADGKDLLFEVVLSSNEDQAHPVAEPGGEEPGPVQDSALRPAVGEDLPLDRGANPISPDQAG